jgi:hypothetical protein
LFRFLIEYDLVALLWLTTAQDNEPQSTGRTLGLRAGAMARNGLPLPTELFDRIIGYLPDHDDGEDQFTNMEKSIDSINSSGARATDYESLSSLHSGTTFNQHSPIVFN